jgi:hypothetical protein
MGNLVFQATLGGQVNLVGPNTASTFNLNVPATSSTIATLTGTETFTNKTLTSPTLTTPVLGTPSSGTLTNCTGLPNAGLVNSSVTVGSTAIALGATSTTLAGLTSVASNTLTSAASTALTLQSAGTTAITVDTAQRVGIGTASPSAARLQVVGVTGGYVQKLNNVNSTRVWAFGVDATATDDGKFVIDDVTAGSNRVCIDTSGNVGIGTSSPGSKLDISGNVRISNGGGFLAFTGAAGNKYIGQADALITSASPTDLGIQTTNNILFATGGTTERMRIDSSGNTLFGTTGVPNGTSIYGSAFVPISAGRTRLAMATNSTGDLQLVQFFNPNGQVGNISTNLSATSYNTSSDYRLKEAIAPMTGALAKVAQLKPSTYKWKVDGSDGEGFIAHELAEVCPHAVSGNKDAVDEDGKPVYQGIDVSFLVATLTAALQETKAVIDTQAETINALTARIVALEAK